MDGNMRDRSKMSGMPPGHFRNGGGGGHSSKNGGIPDFGRPSSAPSHRSLPNSRPSSTQHFPRPNYPPGEDAHRNRYGMHQPGMRRPHPEEEPTRGNLKASDLSVKQMRENQRHAREAFAKRNEAALAVQQNSYQNDLETYFSSPLQNPNDNKLHKCLLDSFLKPSQGLETTESRSSSPVSLGPTSRPTNAPPPPPPQQQSQPPQFQIEQRSSSSSSSSNNSQPVVPRPTRDPIQAFSAQRLKPDQLNAAAKRARRAAAARDGSPRMSLAGNDIGGYPATSSSNGPSNPASRSTMPPPPADDVDVMSLVTFPKTEITPIKQNLHADPNDFPTKEKISPLKNQHMRALLPTPTLVAPAPHVPPPPTASNSIRDGETSSSSSSHHKKSSSILNGHSRVPESSDLPSNSQKLTPIVAESHPMVPEMDTVMDDLSLTDNSINSNSNDSNSNEESSDSSSSSSSEVEDNDVIDRKPDPKTEMDEGDAKGKEASNWRLGFLFADPPKNDDSKSRNSAESRPGSSSGRSNANRNRGGDQPSSENRRSPASRYSYQKSPLSENSSDEEVTRPTPQAAAVPRLADAHLSSSSDEKEQPLTLSRKPKKEAALGKLSAASAKGKAGGKGKPGRPSRARKAGLTKAVLTKAEQALESKAKSRAYLSTDESSSDSEDERPARPIAQLKPAPPSRKPSSKKGHSATAVKETSARVKASSHPSKSLPSSNKCNFTPVTPSLTPRFRISNTKSYHRSDDNNRGPFLQNFRFTFSKTITTKKLDRDDLDCAPNSSTSDAVKSVLLKNIYTKKKDHGHNDASNKGKRKEIESGTDDSPAVKVAKTFKEEDVKSSSSVKGKKSSKNCDIQPPSLPTLMPSSKKRTEAPKDSSSSRSHKRVKEEPVTRDQDAEIEPRRRGKKNSNSGKVVGSPGAARSTPNEQQWQGSSSSRCPSRASNCEETTGSSTSPAVAASGHLTNSRVPVEGESLSAFNSRQSHTSAVNATPTVSQPSGSAGSTLTSPNAAVEGNVPLLGSRPDPQMAPLPAREENLLRTRPLIHSKPALLAGFSDYPIPDPIISVYPCIGEMEGKSMEEKFYRLFGNTEEKKYIERGIELKRLGDDYNNLDIAFMSTKYLEAVIFFILSGSSMEADPLTPHAAVPMYTDTIKLITWVSSVFQRKGMHSSQPNDVMAHCIPKLTVLCLLTQSLLSLKIFSAQKQIIREGIGSLRVYCKEVEKKLASCGLSGMYPNGNNNTSNSSNSSSNAIGANGQPAAVATPGTTSCAASTEKQRVAHSPSALSSTPSPTNSVNSESSSSSGYNTTPVVATPSPPQENAPMVEIPQDFHTQLTRNFAIQSSLITAYEMWEEAMNLIEQHRLQEFFACLNRAVCPLSFHSNVNELVVYIKTGLREVERIRRVHGGEKFRPRSSASSGLSSTGSQGVPSRPSSRNVPPGAGETLAPPDAPSLHH